MTETTFATAGAAPSADAIREILVRLEDASALFRCAATCRRWRAIAADPSFLRRLWPDWSFVGFFTGERRRGEGVSFVPGPRSALGAGRRLLSSYIPDAPSLSDWVQPLASHRGLLLVRLFPRDPGTMQLAVCDPLAGTWDVLPTLRVDDDAGYILGYAIVVTGADCCSSSSTSDSPSFKVLLARTVPLVTIYVDWEEEDGEEHILHAFSSGQSSWGAPIKFPDHVELSLQEATIAHTAAAVCRGGEAHWLVFAKPTNLHIVRVNHQTDLIASTQLLIPGNHHHETIRLTTAADGTLLSLCTYDGDSQVEIWEQQQQINEDDDVRWLRTKVFELTLQLQRARCLCFGARNRMLLMMDRRHQCVYVLDLKFGAMEKMEDEFYDPNLIAVPMEIDWPYFFMSRLRLV